LRQNIKKLLAIFPHQLIPPLFSMRNLCASISLLIAAISQQLLCCVIYQPVNNHHSNNSYFYARDTYPLDSFLEHLTVQQGEKKQRDSAIVLKLHHLPAIRYFKPFYFLLLHL